jgi:16S rRNA (cytosine967-C5)-methyltransferase
VRSGLLADRVLMHALEQVPVRDRPLTHELAFGTIRLRGRIDFLLAAFVRRGLERVDPDVLDVLRLGVYQLTSMHGVPAYAAVSQAVEQAMRVGGRSSGGFVNGVLQSVRREAHAVVFPALAENPVAHLTTWGSHPPWLAERWVARFGATAAAQLVDANNRTPELYLRPIGISVDDAQQRLAAAGIRAEPPDIRLGAGVAVPNSLRLLAPVSITAALAAVPGVIQDPAATLVADALAAPPGAIVADLCAAPGGKALGIASASAPPALVVAADISAARLARLRENVARTAVRNVAVVVADARRPPFARADAVLLDAPCTGTGTFRRHPDGRWRVTEQDLAALVTLQREILDGAAAIVPPGGALLYATCSLEREENEDQVTAFLERHPAFVLEPIEQVHEAVRDRAGRLVVTPQQFGVDGAFAARLRRS